MGVLRRIALFLLVLPLMLNEVNADMASYRKQIVLRQQELAVMQVAVIAGLHQAFGLDGKITDALVRVNSIENQADDIYDLSIERLFEMEQDVKMLIKKREVYHAMETATDKCEDAGNAIESIIVKYA